MVDLSFPLDLRFKTIAIARQISVEDASGRLLWYVKMKAFKLREAVVIFEDREQTRPVFEIQADRVIDIGANYEIRDAVTHAPVGTLHNMGVRSMWRSAYELVQGGQVIFKITEENPWTKVMDGFVRDIPILGLFAGYVLHPRYLATAGGGEPALRMRKESAFFEGRYSIERVAVSATPNERLLVLGLLMLALLEKDRG
ncbi:MAG: hypothetical protein ABIS27_07960 [Longimicrobiales bacterium]